MYPILFVFISLFIWANLAWSENKFLAESFLGERIILLDFNEVPTLQYICLKEGEIDFPFVTASNFSPIELISTIQWEDNKKQQNKSSYLSTINTLLISDWLIGQNIRQIDLRVDLRPFLFEESYRIQSFLKKQNNLQITQLLSLNKELADRNTSTTYPISSVKPEINKNTINPKNSQGDFAQYALYLILGGGVFIIYSVLAPTASSNNSKKKAGKIELARRKRWIIKIFEKGWIDRPTYLFLLKKIESLPEWLGGIKPMNQSVETADPSENSVAFNNRKSGESVVKTKETSFDKTFP